MIRIRIIDSKGNGVCSFNCGVKESVYYRTSRFQGCSVVEMEKNSVGTFLILQLDEEETPSTTKTKNNK